MADMKKEESKGKISAAKEAQPQETEDAPEKRIDETVPGGRYIVNGQAVNAFGEPIKE